MSVTKFFVVSMTWEDGDLDDRPSDTYEVEIDEVGVAAALGFDRTRMEALDLPTRQLAYGALLKGASIDDATSLAEQQARGGVH
jgi:hypothetical protein